MSNFSRTLAIAGGAVFVAAIVVAISYCWAIPWSVPSTPGVPPYESGGGFAYCGKLGEAALQRSSLDTLAACLAALLGSCAVILGNVMETAPLDTARRRIRNPSIMVLNFGVLLLVMSHYEFSRADAASMAASTTAVAQAEAVRPDLQGTPDTPEARDRTAFVSCAMVRATWLKSRVDSSALVQSEIEHDRNRQRQTDSGAH